MRWILLILLFLISGCAYNETFVMCGEGECKITVLTSTEKPVKVSTDLDIPLSPIP